MLKSLPSYNRKGLFYQNQPQEGLLILMRPVMENETGMCP